MRLTLERLSKQFKNRIAVENVNAEMTEGIYGRQRSREDDSDADDMRDRIPFIR